MGKKKITWVIDQMMYSKLLLISVTLIETALLSSHLPYAFIQNLEIYFLLILL